MANIIRYNPFNEVVSLREAMDRLFEDNFIPRGGFGVSARGAQSNLYETAEGFVLQIPMPGVNSDEVEITAQQDTLTLKWATKVTVPENAITHWTASPATSTSTASPCLRPSTPNGSRPATRTAS